MTNKEDLKELKDAFLTIKQEWLEDRNVKLTEWQKKVFDSIEKDLEVLEILKNKQVNIHFDLVVKDTYEEYLAGVEGSKESHILTEEEWVELKEWLENGKL